MDKTERHIKATFPHHIIPVAIGEALKKSYKIENFSGFTFHFSLCLYLCVD